MKRFLKKPAGFAFITCFVLFTVLAIFAAGNYTLPGDEAAGSFISGIDSPFFKWLIESISLLGETPAAAVIVIALIIILLIQKRRIEAFFISILPATGAVVNLGFKVLIDRSRPGDDILEGGLSFPSGHTTFAVILFGFLIYLTPKLITNKRIAYWVQVFCALLILFMGISRVYLEAHWLSDTLGSLLLGGMILATAVTVYDTYRRRENVKVA